MPKKRVLTAEEVEQACSLYKAGKAASAIAKLIKAPKPAVLDAVRAAGIPIRKGGPIRRVFSKEETSQIRKRYLDGETVKAIADSFSVAQLVIADLIRDGGITVGVREMTQKDVEDMAKLYQEEGLSLSAIESRYPWGRHRIAEALNSAGVNTSKVVTEADHKKKIAAHGKAELVGAWTNAGTITKYRCLLHGEIHPAWPQNVAKGHGLQCCLVNQDRGAGQRLAAKNSFDKKLKKRWGDKVRRVGEYINNNTQILFECLEHKQQRLARPANVLYFGGLSCCRDAAQQERADRLREEAKERYDSLLEERGRLERVGEYITALTPILHRCKMHGEVHFKTPNGALSQHGKGGLICCKATGNDSLEAALNRERRFEADEETYFYVFSMENSTEHLKPGIAKDLDARADEEYGDLENAWLRSSRAEAFFLEQAVLHETRNLAHYPDDLSEWTGRTELRRMDLDQLLTLADHLVEQMDELGPWEFALQHIPMGGELKKQFTAKAQVAG